MDDKQVENAKQFVEEFSQSFPITEIDEKSCFKIRILNMRNDHGHSKLFTNVFY